MNNASWLQRQALLHPKRLAFLTSKESWSFSLLAQYAQNTAAYYYELLPANTTRVAIYSQNHTNLYLTILGLWELGIEIQFLNRRLTKSEMLYQLQDANTQVVITDDAHLSFESIVAFGFPNCVDLPVATAHFDLGYREDQIASIMYTSGTTGNPKGVPQRFSNHLASANATKKNMHLNAHDTWGLVLPLFHISGLSVLLRSVALGLTVRFYDDYAIDTVIADVKTEKVTILSFVTKMLTDFVTNTTKAYPGLKAILLGGGPVSKHLLEQAKDKHIPVLQSFGMTETCSQIVALPFDQATKKLGSAGYPLENVTIQIHQPDENGIGELYVNGPSVVKEYLNGRAQDSWTKTGELKTGDLAYLDRDGALYLVSRLSELIISGGENIYPAEIEHVLVQLPEISEAAVVGLSDATWGQVPVAYLVLNQHTSVAQIEAILRKQLAKYKLPKAYYIVQEIPKTANGKPLKRLFLTKERVNTIEYQLT